ncbi:MAG: DUF4124 domain-containing protein, partial [Cytophagales bacterium]|nr:DUF4124 domain-containing protein [Rhizobacter sp.]
LAALALCLVCACAGVQAQTVYRCGPDGRVYSQTPCPQGRAVNVSDERSADQRAAAESRVREDQSRGDALERERLDREAGKPAAAGKIEGRPAPPEPAKPAAKPSKKKKPKAKKPANDDFKAVAPAPKPKNQPKSR